jgi:hypothetical protein
MAAVALSAANSCCSVQNNCCFSDLLSRCNDWGDKGVACATPALPPKAAGLAKAAPAAGELKDAPKDPLPNGVAPANEAEGTAATAAGAWWSGMLHAMPWKDAAGTLTGARSRSLGETDAAREGGERGAAAADVPLPCCCFCCCFCCRCRCSSSTARSTSACSASMSASSCASRAEVEEEERRA